ncbi:MAG: tetratricopeptide repeat protein [Candidatus Pacebacteria bacterium]|nr:tetratricopeptide repeat protein [Candidatus Paceibacterota bacterium]
MIDNYFYKSLCGLRLAIVLKRILCASIAVFLLSACESTPVAKMIKANINSSFVIRDDVAVRPEIKSDFEKAVKLLQEKDYERGIRLMTRVVERSEMSIAPHINLGIAYRITGDMKRAEKSLTKALEMNSIHPSANNEMGMVYRKTGRFAEARRSYERILERFTSFLPARKNLGILCDLYINDLNCAMANYEIYNKADPGDKEVIMWIADLRTRMGN